MKHPGSDFAACSGGLPPRLDERQGRRWMPLAVVCAAIGVCAALLYLFNPGQFGFYPVCWFYKTTSLLCPGCGSLRATHQLLHGNLGAALHDNVIFVASLPVLGWVGLRMSFLKLKAGSAPMRVKAVWLWTAFGVLVLFGILRNLPFAPFAYLRP